MIVALVAAIFWLQGSKQQVATACVTGALDSA